MDRKPLVFTDLDGTLLDHHTYRFDEAQEVLDCLKYNDIPLVIVTSKTRPEVLELQRKLGICEPFIIENGAGAFLPASSPLASGFESNEDWVMVSEARRYDEVRMFFEKMKYRFGLKGYDDMDVNEVMALTDLDEVSAHASMQRDFTEPFIIKDRSKIPDLTDLAHKEGLDIIEGGRFFHLITMGQNKGRAVKMLAAQYATHYDMPVRIIALGDSANDYSMLKAADDAVLIRRYDDTYAPMDIKGLIQSPFKGPKGWNSTLKELLDVCQG